MKKKFAQLFILLLTALITTACAKTGDDKMETAANSSTNISESVNSASIDESTSSKADEADENIPKQQYSVGDIILGGGTTLKPSELSALNGEDLPVAVVAGVKDDGAFFAVGVYRSEGPLQWESDETGDSPAFDFIDSYAENHGLKGAMASGWYMPSIEELRTLYDNRDVVNEALERIWQLDSSAAIEGLSTTWYWSSTQSESQEDYAWFVHFYNGYAGECPKNFTNVNVISIREL